MNLFGLAGLLIAVTSFPLSIIVFIHNPKVMLNRVWGLFAVTVGIWGIGVYKISGIPFGNESEAFLWWRLAHVGIIFIPIFFFHFVVIFLNIKKRLLVYTTYVLGLLFLMADATPYFIANMQYVFDQFYYDSPPGIFYTPFVIFFGYFVVFGHYLLIKKYHDVSKNKQNQIRWFFIATILGFLGGATAFFPVFGIDVYPIGSLSVPLYPLIISYSIVRHQFFDMKIIATELLIIVSWMLIFAYIFLSTELKIPLVDIAVFGVILFLGVMVIRGVLKEFTFREHLQEKVDEQTKEIKRAYEVEKRARIKLEDLNKTKSEFVATAAHQLRTPLSATRWALRTLLDGDMGKINLNDIQKELLDKTYNTNNNLIDIVGDLLDVTYIEEGGIKYNLKKNNIAATIKEVVESAKLLLKNKQIGLSFKDITTRIQPFVFDETKILMALKNIISNAIDYTPDGGKVEVNLKKDGKFAVIEVTDTGIGIAKDHIEHIFDKFYRSPNAKKMETDRSGLGLWITKRIIEEHGGTINIESKEGEGTKVKVRLPMVY